MGARGQTPPPVWELPASEAQPEAAEQDDDTADEPPF
jgi:hypothetical protein